MDIDATSRAYREIAALLAPRGVRPWTWSVAPHDSTAVALGLGVSDNETRARRAVEETMAKYAPQAAFGLLEGPAVRERCLRTEKGECTWLPCR